MNRSRLSCGLKKHPQLKVFVASGIGKSIASSMSAVDNILLSLNAFNTVLSFDTEGDRDCSAPYISRDRIRILQDESQSPAEKPRVTGPTVGGCWRASRLQILWIESCATPFKLNSNF